MLIISRSKLKRILLQKFEFPLINNSNMILRTEISILISLMVTISCGQTIAVTSNESVITASGQRNASQETTTVVNQVKINPELLELIPEEYESKFTENGIKCLNWYWERKKDYEEQERKRWNCPVVTCNKTTAEAKYCCVTHIVVHRMRFETEPKEDDHFCWESASTAFTGLSGVKLMDFGLKEFFKMTKQQCQPKYMPYSDSCLDVAEALNIEDVENWWTEESSRVNYTLDSIIDDDIDYNISDSDRTNGQNFNNSNNNYRKTIIDSLLIHILLIILIII